MHFLLLVLSLQGVACLTCYKLNDDLSLGSEECSSWQNSCRLLWDTSPHIQIQLAGCFQHADCNSTRCHAFGDNNAIESCCCNSDYCNILSNLDPRATPRLPPTFSTLSPLESGSIACAVYDCNDGGCRTTYEFCESCRATYTRTENHFDLFQLGCNPYASHNCSDQCVIDSRQAKSTITCCCSTNNTICNAPSNIIFTDSSRITHFVEDAGCRQLQCEHVCVTFRDGRPAVCHCRSGYVLSADNHSCNDVDECSRTSVRPCHATAQCVNENGNFRCVCPSGKTMETDGSCVDIVFGCSTNLKTCPFSDTSCERDIESCPVTAHNAPACYLQLDLNFMVQLSGCITEDSYCGNTSCTTRLASADTIVCCCLESRCTEHINTTALMYPNRVITTTSMTASTGQTQSNSTITGARAEGTHLTVDMIVGVVVGVVMFIFALLLIGTITACCCRRLRQKPSVMLRLNSMDNEDQLQSSFIGKILDTTKVLIGQGRFGRVYKAQTTDEHHPVVAIKKYANKESLTTEAAIISTLDHVNVVKYLDHSVRQLILVMEHIGGGSLLSILRSSRIFTWGETVNLAKSFMEGLAYLHGQRSIAHRDVKSSNVLVDGCCCKVADFGLAISFAEGMERDSRSTQTQVGTPRYMAVEIIQGQIDRFELSTYASIDVYAAGLVLWEILTRTEPPTSQQNTRVPPYKPPFSDIWHELHIPNPSVHNMAELYRNPNHRPAIPSYFLISQSHDGVVHLIQDMWAEQAQSRPTSSFCMEKLTALLPNSQLGNGEVQNLENIEAAYERPYTVPSVPSDGNHTNYETTV